MIKTNWLLGGFQAHQNWRNDGYCTSLTAAMGMGGGYTPCVLMYYERDKNDRSCPTSKGTKVPNK